MRIVSIVILASCLVAVAGAVSITADYVGEGEFHSRALVGGQFAEASGSGNLAYGHWFTGGEAFTGYDFDGKNGRFRTIGTIGPVHAFQIGDAAKIYGNVTIRADSSIVNAVGVGSFRERIYDIVDSQKGRRNLVLGMDAAGDFEVNSTVVDDSPRELYIEEFMR